LQSPPHTPTAIISTCNPAAPDFPSIIFALLTSLHHHQQAECKDGKAESVTFVNTPSFVGKLGVEVEVWCAFSDMTFHSRMPLDTTHVRLKRTCVFTTNGIPLQSPLALIVAIIIYAETPKVPTFGKVTCDIAYGGMWYCIVDAESVGTVLVLFIRMYMYRVKERNKERAWFFFTISERDNNFYHTVLAMLLAGLKPAGMRMCSICLSGVHSLIRN
jgi:hypothetical protein